MSKKDKDIKLDDSSLKENNNAEEGTLTDNMFDIVRAVAFALIIVAILLTFVFRLVKVDGHSMMDTLYDQDRVIVTNFLYTPENGDVVVISHGAEYDTPLIKRVIAKEGQTVRVDAAKGQVIVDNVILDEPYIKELVTTAGQAENTITVPKGMVFVMGDNRNHSADSRDPKIGLIDVNDIIGKAQYVLFPFDRFKNIYE